MFRIVSTNVQAHVMDADQFYGGASARLECWIGLIQLDDLKIRIRGVLIVLMGWFPLLLLVVIQDRVYGVNRSPIRASCSFKTGNLVKTSSVWRVSPSPPGEGPKNM